MLVVYCSGYYCGNSAELELSSLKQQLEESTAVSEALRLELQLCQQLTRTTDDDKESRRGASIYWLTRDVGNPGTA